MAFKRCRSAPFHTAKSTVVVAAVLGRAATVCWIRVLCCCAPLQTCSATSELSYSLSSSSLKRSLGCLAQKPRKGVSVSLFSLRRPEAGRRPPKGPRQLVAARGMCACSRRSSGHEVALDSSSSSIMQPQQTPAQPTHRTDHMRRHRSSRPGVASLLLLAALLLAAQQPAAAAAADGKPLQIAIVNQVHFHLEVVAGAMHVCKEMTSDPVTVYLPAKVLKTNWYGFINWLGGREGFIWKEGKEYDGKTTYDLVWFITPERHIPWVTTVSQQMQPKVAMYMVHNGHLPDSDFKALRTMSGKLPLLTLSPHVAKNITGKTGDVAPEWILPIFPYTPATQCQLEDLQAGKNCLKGFSVQGRIEKARRNYTQMWEQIGSYRKKEGAAALSNFRLNILGEVVEYFAVPADVRDLVAVYKNPPYPIFYDVVYHSYALVPMLASPLYYSSKFSSTVLTSFITGVPIIADSKFMAAYSMIEPNAVYPQEDGKNELDVMFSVARMTADEMWRTRLGLKELRGKMNTRAKDLILGWLKEKGLAPDAKSELGKAAAGGHRRQRRTLLSPLWLLAEAFEQQQETAVLSAADSLGL